LVGLEQDAGAGQLEGGGLAGAEQGVELVAFLRGQGDDVLLGHRGSLPKLKASP
jgi:hypothetical protein